MTNLIAIPLEDDFETTLSSSWNWWAGTVSVNSIPSADTPWASEYTYMVVNPGKSNMQVAKVTAWSWTSLTVTADTIEKGDWVDYSAQSHAAWSVVRFSNNYQFWKDIQTAINSKLNSDALGNFTFTDSTLSATGSMTFSDWETASVTLKTLATWAPADQYVAVSENDTTVWHLEDKLTAWTWITLTKNNPAGNENLAASVDTDVIASKSYVDTTINSSKWWTYTAWEDLLANDAVRFGLWTTTFEQLNWTATTSEWYIWYNTSLRDWWQSFGVMWNRTLTSIKVSLLKTGTPTGNLTCYVYSDQWTTLVATSSNTIAESSLTTSYTDQTFTFAWESLTQWTYYIKIADDRADSTSNYSKRAFSLVDECLCGSLYTIDSTNTWTVKKYDHVFTVTMWSTEDNTKVYKCDADSIDKINFLWFATEAVSADASVLVTDNLIQWWFTWLTTWATQYLSDTAWEISETSWTISKEVWIAVSATEVEIDKKPEIVIGSIWLVNNTAYYAKTSMMVVALWTYWSWSGTLEWFVWYTSSPDMLLAKSTVDSWNNTYQTISFPVQKWMYYKIVLWGTNTLRAFAFPLI